MSQAGIPGISADFGGEVTGKRPSPLPLIHDNDRYCELTIVYIK
jgi:hypothetical protein